MNQNDLSTHVKELATEDGRLVGTIGHQLAKEYIIDRLATGNLTPHTEDKFEMEYQVNGVPFTNISGILLGKNREAAPILVGAHYDAVYGTPGADDNAAAVAILLKLACDIPMESFERSVIVSFFDAEEPPYFLQPSMGSIRYYEDQRRSDIHCALIMDLVGHDVPIDGLEDLLFLTGMESYEDLSQTLLSTSKPSGLKPIPILNSYIGDLSDHHIFRTNQVPYLFLSCGIWKHYHSPTDVPELLNYDKVYKIYEYLIELVKDVDKRVLSGGFEGYDSAPIEAQFINDALQLFLPGEPVITRGDIDRVVTVIAQKFSL